MASHRRLRVVATMNALFDQEAKLFSTKLSNQPLITAFMFDTSSRVVYS